MSLDHSLLDQYRQDVEKALDAWLPTKKALPERLHRAIHYMVFGGGKRIRPVIVLMSGEILSASKHDLLPPACAVELVHTYSLVHDDLPAMDDDDLRRGRSSCHIKFDESTAILTGDALQALAFNIISTHSSNDQLAGKLHSELSTYAGSHFLVGGQQMDMESSINQNTQYSVTQIHERKTAALFIASFRMAVRVSGQEDQLERFTSIGKHLGLAFQITDDILDIEQSDDTLGKTSGTDVKQNKMTYPSELGVEKAQQEADHHIEQVEKLLKPFGERANNLRNLARFVIQRTH